MTRSPIDHSFSWNRVGLWLALWLALAGAGLMILPAAAMAQEIAQEIAQEAPVFGEHVVAPGETLSEIAQDYGLTLAELMAANGIRNADSVKIDQVLRIPAGSATLPVADAPQADPAAPLPISIHSLNRRYVVAEGDTVIRIADRFGLDLSTLLRLNDLGPNEASRLVIGQTLVLPATPDELIVTPPDSQYIVQPGDSLGLIAETYNLTQAQLQAANDISNPELLRVGQSLIIPGQSASGGRFSLGLPVAAMTITSCSLAIPCPRSPRSMTPQSRPWYPPTGCRTARVSIMVYIYVSLMVRRLWGNDAPPCLTRAPALWSASAASNVGSSSVIG